MQETSSPVDLELADEMANFYADPLGFVRFAFPWGEPGQLEHEVGPDTWQEELLREIGEEVKARKFDGVHAVKAIREAVASGHGIGKSTLVAWVVCWILSTRPNSLGTVTANTRPQLDTKTWAAILRWMKLCITSHWFVCNSERIYHRDHPASWFCSAQTCKKEQAEAFQGQHAKDSTSFYIIDEASGVPEEIWVAAEGGLTDGEPMIFAFGNPTRNEGKFYRIVFGNERHLWKHRSIDSRTSKLTNKETIAEMIRQYGEDSDRVKVRVRGMAPATSDIQFIPTDVVEGARNRVVVPFADEPIIAGVDVSGGGEAWTVCRFRKGLDARSIPPIRINGEASRDREMLVARLAQVLSNHSPKVTMMFIDSAFGSPICERLKVLGFRNVVEVNFGGVSPDIHQLNMRAFMYQEMRDWLERGCIDKNDEKLAIDLTAPGFHFNLSQKLVIESKEEMQKRGVDPTDDGDALGLTFAKKVAPPKKQSDGREYGGGGWMG